jgi:hypothetical protein
MPCPTVAAASKNPNGSAVRIWSGSMRKWPRRVSGARMSHERSARPPRVIARPGRPPGSVAAAVAQCVGHTHPIADVAVQLADRVARLQVRQAEPYQHVRATDDEDPEVQQVEQEIPAGRERGDDEDRREGDGLETSKHPLTCGSGLPGR